MPDEADGKRPDQTLDLRGLKCPLPAEHTRKALERAHAGDILIVECTDPMSQIDIPNLVNRTGNVLEATECRNAVFLFRIGKR